MQCNSPQSGWRVLFCLAALTFTTASASQLEAGDEQQQLFLSDWLQHKFLECNSVRVDKFSASDEPKKTAELSLEDGPSTFNAFGDLKGPDQLEGFSVGITLQMIRAEDPMKIGRKLYSVTPTKRSEPLLKLLGKNQLRLMWTPPNAKRPGSIRLLLISPDEKVQQTLDLRQNGT